MVAELTAVLTALRKEPIQQQIEGLNEILNDLFSIILQLPDLVENEMNDLRGKLAAIDKRLDTTQSDVATLKAAPASQSSPTPLVAPPPAPKSDFLPANAPTTDTPQSPAPQPSPAKPAPQQTVRQLVMGELKDMLARRKKFLDLQN